MPEMTESDIRMLQSSLRSPEGRETIAQTMLEPFKLGRDFFKN